MFSFSSCETCKENVARLGLAEFEPRNERFSVSQEQLQADILRLVASRKVPNNQRLPQSNSTVLKALVFLASNPQTEFQVENLDASPFHVRTCLNATLSSARISSFGGVPQSKCALQLPTLFVLRQTAFQLSTNPTKRISERLTSIRPFSHSNFFSRNRPDVRFSKSQL